MVHNQDLQLHMSRTIVEAAGHTLVAADRRPEAEVDHRLDSLVLARRQEQTSALDCRSLAED